MRGDDAEPQTWKTYLKAAFQFLFTFYLATFALGVLFLKRGEDWHRAGLILGVLYAALIIVMLIKMLRKLSMAAVMVAAPTIPLCMLILVVSLLPTLQWLDKRFHLRVAVVGA